MKKIMIFIFLLLSILPSKSQEEKLFSLDRVVAEVEDKIILESDIQNLIADMKRQNMEVPDNPECDILEQQVVSKLLTARAKRDSINISDAEVERDIELRIRNFIQMYGSLENLEKISGRTIFQIKQDFHEAIRDIKLAENMQKKIVENIVVTPVEVRNYFESILEKDLPYYESEVELGLISIYVKPSQDLNEFIKNELLQYRDQVKAGRVSFDFLVNNYSEDPAKVQNKGIYQVNVNDKFWDPNFLSACFKLETDEISLPVKSKFGYHLIKMQERRGTSATVQHLLRISIPSELEIEETHKKILNIREKIMAKEMTFEKAVELHSEDELAKFAGGYFAKQDGSTKLTYDQIDPEIYKIVQDMKEGDISAPQKFTSQQGASGFRILYLKSQEKPHRESLELDYKKISDRLLTKKRKEVLDQWIKKNIRQTNWSTIDKYLSCPSFATWKSK